MPPKKPKCLHPTRNGPCGLLEGHKSAHRSETSLARIYAAQSAKDRAWRAANPELARVKARESARAWRSANPGYDVERRDRYYDRERHAKREYSRRYKKRVALLPGFCWVEAPRLRKHANKYADPEKLRQALLSGSQRSAAAKGRAAESSFRDWCAAHGYRLVPYAAWKGNKARYAAVCPNGHECNLKPNHVLSGVAACRLCRAKNDWDSVYILINRFAGELKFGISGSIRPRLASHRKDGFTEVYLVCGFPDPLTVENAVKQTLKLAGETPVRGYEYFPISTLALVEDVIWQYEEEASACTEEAPPAI